MATADYWSEADLKALTGGGLVNEDVMQKIWDISRIPLPFTDAVGTGKAVKNSYHTWTKDSQAAPDTANARVDGADATTNKAAGGSRVGNHCQISDKLVEVTERANAVDTIGRANEMAYQIGMRQRDLRRDIEAIALMPQASRADNGDSTAGLVGTFPSWLTSNTDVGAAPGADGGFGAVTPGIVTAPTAGDARALQTDTIKDMVESVYLNNGNVSLLMTVPQIIRRLNNYAIANPTDFGIATPTANISGSGGKVEQTGQGFMKVWVTDFGTTVTLVSNRLQQTYASGDSEPSQVADLFLIDTGMVEFCDLIPEHTEALGKAGTADKKQISRQWSLRVMDEKAHAVIRDLTPTGTVTDDGS